MSDPFIVSIHIPKTAGNSLGLIFDRSFRRRIMYDYQDYSYSQDILPEVRENAGFIRSYFDVLHGHFFASKYFDAFPDAAFVATLRHPVDRIVSQFLHELNEDSSLSWYHKDITSGRMDIVDFAGQNGVRDAMSQHLAGRDLADYAVLLISERFMQSLQVMNAFVRELDLETHFGSPPVLPYLNRANDRPRGIEINQTQREAIFNVSKADNEVYATGVRLLEGRLEQLS
jgi:hypothetical protein